MMIIIIFCRNNPIIHVEIADGSDQNALFVNLRGPVQFSIGFEVSLVVAHRKHNTFEKTSTNTFRYGYTVLELNGLPSGTYAIQVMTFNQGQEGPFILDVESTADFKLKRVQ
jgi:regulator of RNase E activity RraB